MKQKDDKCGDAGNERARHQCACIRHDHLKFAQHDPERHLLGRQHDGRPQEIVIVRIEREQPQRDQPGNNERAVYAQKDIKLARAVYARRLRDLSGRLFEKRAQKQHPVYAECRRHDDRAETVRQPQIVDHQKARDQRYHTGEHHGRRHDLQNNLLARQMQVRQRISTERTGQKTCGHSEKPSWFSISGRNDEMIDQ